MTPMRRYSWVLFVAALACGHHAAPVTTPDPGTLLVRTRAKVRAGDFRHAQQDLRRLMFELPPNDSALPEVHYLLAESLFQLGQYVEAAQEFRQTADQFAGTPYAPMALLRAGDANLRLWRNPELDPTSGQTALAIYQELAGRYPESEAAARAQLHVHELREWFAEKDYKTGVFYYKRRAYDSGIIYFKDLVANYPESRWAGDALLRLADSYRAIGYKDELRETCTHVRRFYPQTEGIDRSCPPDSTAGAS
jgi:outer membrane assembly lipoprotein YfiO